MNNFYEILDLLYKVNHKMPEIRFGQLMHNLALRSENLFYMDDGEIVKRLKELLKEINED